MPSTLIIIPYGFHYVGAALLSTAFLLVGQGFTVSKLRKRAGIKYPQTYADNAQVEASKDAKVFNCAQRAHQNTLESIPIIYTITLIGGIEYPVLSAVSCAVWTLSRISYTRGYITGDPKKRLTPLYILGAITSCGQILVATFTAGGWLYADFAARCL